MFSKTHVHTNTKSLAVNKKCNRCCNRINYPLCSVTQGINDKQIGRIEQKRLVDGSLGGERETL